MNKEAEAAAHGVAMQIAAMNPIAIDNVKCRFCAGHIG